jgi:hypothetical protein
MSGVRSRIDPITVQLVDMLDDCYYGTPQYNGDPTPENFIGRAADGWKHDVSHPFLGTFDKQATPALSKLAFDILHGIMAGIVVLGQHTFNCDHNAIPGSPATYAKTPETKYNQRRDHFNNVTGTVVGEIKANIRAARTAWNGAGLSPTMNALALSSVLTFLRSDPVFEELWQRRTDLRSVFDADSTVDVST